MAKSAKGTVFVGMSGGVDSSVTALLLKEQGYRVVGVYMKNWSKDLPGMKCPWAEDLADAKRVAVKLGIDFLVWDFEKAYFQKVVEYMLDEFKKGNTPNPDIMCNQEIKFKLFYEMAMEQGADLIATGHYARVRVERGAEASRGARASRTEEAGRAMTAERGPQLLRAVDESKDQTYFLYRISDEALLKTLFPIGGMLKRDVKKLAEANGLHNAYKKESMGVCFVGEVSMKDFLKSYIDVRPGEIREVESEKVVGQHEGAVFYTIGQRHGLYLSGNVGEVNTGLPYYVVKKDLEKNIVYVSRNLNHAEIWVDKLELKEIVYRGGGAGREDEAVCEDAAVREDAAECEDAAGRKKLLVRLRHLGKLVPAELSGNTLHFNSKIKRPAAGQSAVFYDGEVCLGGGIIC